MKIKEARQAYTEQLNALRNRQKELLKQKRENDSKMSAHGQGMTLGDDGAVLELSEEYRKRAQKLQEKLDSVKEQIDEHVKLRDQVIETEAGIINAESSKQQGEAMEEYGEEMAKCLEIARRISNGDRVPASDEQKLMDFNMEIYMTVKNMAAMNMDKKHKDYDSLWGDEEEKGEDPDPRQMAADTEINVEIPELNLEDGVEG